MGGVNHQPCNKYLRNSTKVSLFLTLAQAEFQLANVAFEKALLLDLDGKRSSPKKILHKLEQSKNALISFGQALLRLKNQMDGNHFKDLPTLRTINLTQRGKKMSESGIVNISSWIKIQKLMENQGFYGVLASFTLRVREIIEMTNKLQEEFVEASWAFERSQLNQLLEQNMEGNVKATFAKLFREWSDFLNDFLASSMISTELWYAHSGYGSIMDTSDTKEEQPQQQVFSRSRPPHFMVHESSV